MLDLSQDPAWLEAALKKVDVGDVWGIGGRWSAMLNQRGIFKAIDLRDPEDGWVRQKMGVVGLRVVHELRGISCLSLEEVVSDKQSCCVSRSFGKIVTELEVMKEAVASHAARAAEKLRHGQLVASHITVFMLTDRFDDDKIKPKSEYESAATADLGGWTADTRRLVGAAMAVTKRLFRLGREYKKAGVLLPYLERAEVAPRNLFDRPDSRSEKLMKAMDIITSTHGRGAVRLAAEGVKSGQGWEMTQSRRSLRYTTRIDELPVVSAR